MRHNLIPNHTLSVIVHPFKLNVLSFCPDFALETIHKVSEHAIGPVTFAKVVQLACSIADLVF